MIQALLDSLDFSGCDEAGKYGLAFYDWLSEDDFKTPVSKTDNNTQCKRKCSLFCVYFCLALQIRKTYSSLHLNQYIHPFVMS